MSDVDIYLKLATLSDEMKKEIGDFVDFLKSKTTTEEKTKDLRKAGLAKGLIPMKEDFNEPFESQHATCLKC